MRVGKLFTANTALILEVAGHFESAKIAEAIVRLIELLSVRPQGDTF